MSELQTAITNLQLKHSELVAAVKSYPGTVASAANAALGEASVEQRKVRDTIQNLRNQIENDGQSLILDWEYDVAVVNGEGKLLSEEVEFSRSTGGGRFNAQGQYEWVEADVPRIDYDPATGECLGLLIEGQRTNLVPYASDVDSAYWSIGRQGVTTVLNAATAPDGSMTADKVVAVAVAGQHRYATNRNLTVNGSARTTMSVFFKGDPGYGIHVNIGGGPAANHFQTWAVDGVLYQKDNQAPNQPSRKLFDVGGGWYRLVITFNHTYPEATILNSHWGICGVDGNTDFLGDGTSGIYIWGAQLETGPTPSSYIPTNGAAVSRAPDVAIAPIGSWFNGTSGAVIVEASSAHNIHSPTASRLFYLGYSNTRPLISVYRSGGNMVGQSAGGNTRTLSEPHPDQSLMRAGISYDRASDTSLFGLAGAVSDFGSAELPEWSPLAALHIGRVSTNSTQQLNGHVQSVTYYPRALSETELQELTAQ